MKKYIFILCIVLLAGFLNSCILDDDSPVNGGIKSEGLTLKYIVEGKNISTYATVAPEEGEDTVNSLYLLFFEPSNDNTGAFIEAVEVPGTLSMNTNISIPLSGSSISSNGAYNVLAVANLTESNYLGGMDIDEWIAQLDGKTEEEVMEESGAFATTGGTINREELLMQGRTTKAAGIGNISLVLTRNLARFDVNNNMKLTHDLVSVSVWNAYPQSSIFGRGVLDYSSSVGRLRRFYGIDNEDENNDGIYPDINGGLYAFENEVVAPANNDNLTTCLIIGLKDHVTSDVTYYRVNVRPRGNAQVLKRNNVYRVTITDVFGPGADSEEAAYTGIGAELGYTINYWDLDDNGLIVQDGANILAIPTKAVRIGAEGGEFSYSIYTFSASGAPASPLQIKSQTWDPQTNDIQATLIGNTLVITATTLNPYMPDRKGVIILSYAGLEASISVLQSNAVNTFLEVVLPYGGIPNFGASAGIPTGNIEVRASGAWTAKILGDDAFSFSNSSTPVKKIVYDPGNNNVSAEIRDDKYFQVWTYLPNTTTDPKETFVLVSLDSDPVNYVSVITLTQNAQGGLTVTPDPVTFTVTNYGIPQTVMVDGTTSNNTSKAWTATILQGAHTDKFILSSSSGDGVTAGQTSFDVSTVGQNLSGGAYTATIRVALEQEPLTVKDITVTQQSSSFSVSPNSNFPVMPKTGGMTPMISVSADPSFHWSATVTMTSGTASDGRTLMNHTAYLEDENGNVITEIQSVGTKFRVVLPKVLWPNREISGITATVTVTLHDAAEVATQLAQTFSITQNSLTSAGLNAANMRITANPASYPTGYGSLRSGYEPAYSTAIRAIFNVVDGVPQANTTYLHAFIYAMGPYASQWNPIETFRTTKDAVTVLAMEEGAGALGWINQANTTISNLGYTVASLTGKGLRDNGGSLDPSSVGKKLYRFLVTDGKYTVPETIIFYHDDVGTEATRLPPTAVPIVKRTSESSGRTLLSIDPTNGVIYMGEPQVVGGYTGRNSTWNNNRQAFLNNLVLYIRYTAEYGTHFSDMLNDNLNVAPPWDPAWGNNCAPVRP